MTARCTGAGGASMKGRAAGLALCAGLALAPTGLLAQAPAASPAPSGTQAARDYAIAPGPLDEALNRFARSAGVLLSFDPQLAEGRQSPGLNGRYTVEEGFSALLAGSNLKAVAQPDGSFALEAAPATSAATLPTVQVQARRDALTTQGTDSYGVRASNTATRLPLSPRETPQSVSVVTRTQMDDFGLLNANEVLANTTGVSVDVVETDRTYFTSRGFDISNFQVDGVGMPFTNGDQLGDLDTALYDRIEVLRGANGLLSSTGNPAATVNYVRKRPTADFQAGAAVSVGSWNKRRIEGDVSGALNEARTLRGRAIIAAQRGDSFMDHYSLEKTVFAGLLEADLGPRTVLTGGVTRQANRPEGTSWGGRPRRRAGRTGTTPTPRPSWNCRTRSATRGRSRAWPATASWRPTASCSASRAGCPTATPAPARKAGCRPRCRTKRRPSSTCTPRGPSRWAVAGTRRWWAPTARRCTTSRRTPVAKATARR
jgi:outer-membrane receptor for ferric coprogen and ferric-rhodotorulic acid